MGCHAYAIWRHCSKRLSEASKCVICVLGSFHRKGCGMLEAPLPQFGMLWHGELGS